MPRSNLAAAGAGNKIVFAGGSYENCLRRFFYLFLTVSSSNGSNYFYSTVDIYDINTGQWNSSAGQLSIARAYLAAAAGGNKIIFAGGLYDANSRLLLLTL